jgi:hypothetical protein
MQCFHIIRKNSYKQSREMRVPDLTGLCQAEKQPLLVARVVIYDDIPLKTSGECKSDFSEWW